MKHLWNSSTLSLQPAKRCCYADATHRGAETCNSIARLTDGSSPSLGVLSIKYSTTFRQAAGQPVGIAITASEAVTIP